MKSILITLLFLCFIPATRAQTNVYVPFPDSNAQWNQNLYTYGVGVGGSVSVGYYGYYYKISHDSIINSKTYHLINFAPRWDTSYYNPGLNPGSPSSESHIYPLDSVGTLIGAIREDSMHRVYYRNLNETFNNYCAVFPFDSDLLIYDFSLKPGDTSSISMYQSGKVIVKGYDSILVGSTYRKVLLVSVPFSPITQVWCEGIGDTALGLLGTQSIASIYPGSCITYLDCFWHNGQDLLDVRNGSCGSFVTGINSPHADTAQGPPKIQTFFQIFPNPATNYLYIKYPHRFTVTQLTIYNSIGQQVYTITNTQVNAINIATLSPGFYFIAATNNYAVLKDNFIKE